MQYVTYYMSYDESTYSQQCIKVQHQMPSVEYVGLAKFFEQQFD